MKNWLLILLFLSPLTSVAEEIEWIETEGKITDITVQQSRRSKDIAEVKFNLEDGTEVITNVELFRIPFIGSLKSVGDKLAIKYDQNNPALAQSVFGNFLATYSMYILIGLGIVFSIKPILSWRKSINRNA
jgi:hypothetical protein